MRDNVSGTPVPSGFPYSTLINQIAAANNVAPCLVAAIKINETGLNDPPDIVSGDGGHGLWQLTSSYPSDWADPEANCTYAVQNFIVPAWEYWAGCGQTGEALVKCIAAEFNGGRGNAQAGFDEGNVDAYTTNNYGARAVANFQSLISGQIPD
jgi:hypothetical protein